MISGRGLHRGQEALVRFAARPGPVTLNGVPLGELVPTAMRSTIVRGRDVELGTVEHLFSALEARSLRDGLAIVVEGPEVPLVDGGARAFVDALAAFDVPPAPRLVVDHAATIDGYEFRTGNTVHVEVAIDFDDPRIAEAASWDGDPIDFRDRIAPARTFGFEHELGALLADGLASHVTPESVIVFASDRVLAFGAPYEEDEPARHKLLDLLGDLYLHGGAPIGSLRAIRPGHARTHTVMRRALDAGVVRAMIAP